jgi:hypothetical protein
MQQELIDNAFYLKEQQWGTWDSYDKNDKCIITSGTKENCIAATRWYLKQKQEGAFDKKSEVTYDSVVGEKL